MIMQERGLYLIKGGDAEAIVSVLGGTVTIFTVGGKNFFYPWHKVGDNDRGGCHGCAPWFGSSSRGSKKHGFLRNMNARGCYIDEKTARFDFRGKQPGYPWTLDYVMGAHIREDGALEMLLQIKRGKDGIGGDAPVNSGLHPYFPCANADKVEVFVGEKMFKGFAQEATIVPLEKDEVLIHISNEKIIRMKLFGDFFLRGKPHLVFWTDASDKYVCVEPIFHDRTVFDTPQGFSLGENEKIELGVSFEIA